MKENKTKEYRAMTDAQLKEALLDLLKRQFTIRMQKASGQFKANHLIKEIRRNVARVKTLLKERVLKGGSA